MSEPEASERVAIAMAESGLEPTSWSNGPGAMYAAHRHTTDKVLVVAVGSITFGLPELRRSVELAVGDRLDLPAGTLHAADVGPDGVTCLEAHVEPGSLGTAPRREDGWALRRSRSGR